MASDLSDVEKLVEARQLPLNRTDWKNHESLDLSLHSNCSPLVKLAITIGIPIILVVGGFYFHSRVAEQVNVNPVTQAYQSSLYQDTGYWGK